MNKEKLEIIHSWASANVEEPCEISPVSNDASFRSYWRLSFDNDTKILMHAPPKLEPLESFLDINIRLDENLLPGMIFLPFCFRESAANILTNSELDPIGKIPELKFSAARAYQN